MSRHHHHHKCKRDPIVGVWTFEFPVSETGKAYGNWILTKDGFIVGGDSTGIGADAGLPFTTMQTPLTGKWKKTGHREYKLFFTNVVVDNATHQVVGRSRYDGTMQISKDGKTLNVQFSNGAAYDKDNLCLNPPSLFPLPSTDTIACKIDF
jgi:hypothetical protein